MILRGDVFPATAARGAAADDPPDALSAAPCAQGAAQLAGPYPLLLMVSRSRTVTVWSSRLWKSTVMQKGVPISSWRR